MEADPLDPFHLHQGAQQVGQRAFLIQVEAVVGQVLRDQDEFAHPFGCQALCLPDQIFNRLAAVAAPHERDGAE